MGTSTYLYFATFKNLSVLLGILGLIYSIFAIITNILASGASTLGTIDYITISLSAKEYN
jgi:hypothetical protein